MKKILAINGSASSHSSNQKLIDTFIQFSNGLFQVAVFNDLKSLPHFDPELSNSNTPTSILNFRDRVAEADGILICTPEYIFSIPSGLKSAIEWCVSTTVFSNKPVGIITASAQGEKGHEELQLIMKTVMANFTPDTTLLIQGIRGKTDRQGKITDDPTKELLVKFIHAFNKSLIENT